MISGTVTLAPALADKAAPTDTVFIFARAVQGARMPLAVIRAQVKDLPIRYQLDDSMAMAPNAKLSGASQVIVSARISKSGNAIPQAGDLAGESTPVAPGATGVAVTISAAVGS
jgi:cytochrome c-type biogenesis protein CcmH